MSSDQNQLIRTLENAYSGAVYDVLRSMGYPHQALPQTLRPLSLSHKLVGPVFPIEGSRDDSFDENETLLLWCTLLSNAPTGYVLMCQPNDSTLSHMGELSAETLAYKGVRGYVVDGGCRDSAFIERLGFPVFCRYYTPVDIVGKWKAHSYGERINIGGVAINKDDFVVADRDGIVLIPKAVVPEVVQKVEEVLQSENQVRTAILQGVDPVEAYLNFGKF